MKCSGKIRLKDIADYIYRGDAPTYVELTGIPVVNQSCISSSGLNFSKVKYHDIEDRGRITSWIQQGDILINSTGTGTLGRVAIVDSTPDIPTFVDSHVTIIRDSQYRFYPKWLFYTLSIQQESMTALCSEGATSQIELSRTRLGNILLLPPEISLQRAIAAYLDRETAKIDAMIDAKQRLRELLKEKRRALITHAVTRGLDPNAPLRESGVPWIGKVPAHWRIESARWLFTLIDLRSTTGQEELLTVSHLTGVTLRSEKDVNMFMAESLEGYKTCELGDLVINTLWAWMGAMGISFQPGLVSPDYHVYRPSELYVAKYLDFLVRMPTFATEVTRYSKGIWSSRLRLYPEEFFEILLPVPPLEEQRAIIEHLQRDTERIDTLVTTTQRSIDLLHERRAALITAAVTGQIAGIT